MTIRELITKLLEFDIDKEVCIDTGHIDDIDNLTNTIVLDTYESFNGKVYVQLLNIE